MDTNSHFRCTKPENVCFPNESRASMAPREALSLTLLCEGNSVIRGYRAPVVSVGENGSGLELCTLAKLE